MVVEEADVVADGAEVAGTGRLLGLFLHEGELLLVLLHCLLF